MIRVMWLLFFFFSRRAAKGVRTSLRVLRLSLSLVRSKTIHAGTRGSPEISLLRPDPMTLPSLELRMSEFTTPPCCHLSYLLILFWTCKQETYSILIWGSREWDPLYIRWENRIQDLVLIKTAPYHLDYLCSQSCGCLEVRTSTQLGL